MDADVQTKQWFRFPFAVLLLILATFIVRPTGIGQTSNAIPWDPPVGNHVPACDNAANYKERLIFPPGTDATLTVSVDATRLAVTGGTLLYSVNGGASQTASPLTTTPSAVTFKIAGNVLSEGTTVDYAFSLSGTFIDPSCLGYHLAVSPTRHSFHSLASSSGTAANRAVWTATEVATLAATDQPGVTNQTPSSTICASWFISSSPCDLYPEVHQQGAAQTPLSPSPNVVWITANPSGSKTCTVKSGFFGVLGSYYDDNNVQHLITEPWAISQHTFQSHDGTTDSRRGILQESFSGSVALGGSAINRSTGYGGYSVTIRSTDVPTGTAVALKVGIPSLLTGRLDVAHSTIAPTGGDYSYTSSYELSQWSYIISGDPGEGNYNTGQTLAHSVVSPYPAQGVDGVGFEDVPSDLPTNQVLIGGSYSWYTQLKLEADASSSFLGDTTADANFNRMESPAQQTRWWLETDHVTLVLPPDSSYSFSGQGCA